MELSIPAAIYTSRRAVIEWLNANGPDVALGAVVRVRSIGDGPTREAVVIRMQAGPHRGEWRLAQRHELGLSKRSPRKRTARRSQDTEAEAKRRLGFE